MANCVVFCRKHSLQMLAHRATYRRRRKRRGSKEPCNTRGDHGNNNFRPLYGSLARRSDGCIFESVAAGCQCSMRYRSFVYSAACKRPFCSNDRAYEPPPVGSIRLVLTDWDNGWPEEGGMQKATGLQPVFHGSWRLRLMSNPASTDEQCFRFDVNGPPTKVHLCRTGSTA